MSTFRVFFSTSATRRMYKFVPTRSMSSMSRIIKRNKSAPNMEKFQMVVWDFDQTVTTGGFHTGGHADHEKLHLVKSHISEDFKQDVVELIEAGVPVGVASFADMGHQQKEDEIAGEEMVRFILRAALGADMESRITVASANPAFHDKAHVHPCNPDAVISGPMPSTKLWHLNRLLYLNGLVSKKSSDDDLATFNWRSVILFDDSEYNVTVADRIGVTAVQVDPIQGYVHADFERALDLLLA